MSTPLPLPTRNASVSDLLEMATVLFRTTLLKCLSLAMGAALLAQLPNFYALATGQELSRGLPKDPTYWLLYAIGLAGCMLPVAIITRRLYELRSGRVRVFSEELSAALRVWPLLVVATLCSFAMVFLGTLLLIVPGVFLAVCLVPMTPVVVLESATPPVAIKRCITLVKPMWVKVFAAVVIAVLVLLVCLIAAFALLGLLVAIGGNPDSAASKAFTSAGILVVDAMMMVFLSSLSLTIYSAASSSA